MVGRAKPDKAEEEKEASLGAHGDPSGGGATKKKKKMMIEAAFAVNPLRRSPFPVEKDGNCARLASTSGDSLSPEASSLGFSFSPPPPLPPSHCGCPTGSSRATSTYGPVVPTAPEAPRCGGAFPSPRSRGSHNSSPAPILTSAQLARSGLGAYIGRENCQKGGNHHSLQHDKTRMSSRAMAIAILPFL
ncbi:hypothetical protein AXG93_2752s1120 [Marchantia polymorpha subsp. ruderalis]|uniref:Uncharacterized protein n=1 Tax=Marchantia polymorpha subsp. ruderalis TaxID=1480154 RepID=A0A176VTF8_MARPO|nr:hypothetical protein AXG93_2752s1120 [Marchantia polymorpha subsp. ruderalis]